MKFANTRRFPALLFPLHGVHHFHARTALCPVDRVVGRLARLAHLLAGQQVQARGVQGELGRQGGRDDALQTTGHGAVHVSRVKQGAENNAVQVDRFKERGEESSLHSQEVPPCKLVTAGHGEETGALQHPVPRLNILVCLDRDGAFPRLDLRSQLTSGSPVGVAIALGTWFGFVGREDSSIATRCRVDVQVKSDVGAQSVPSLGCLFQHCGCRSTDSQFQLRVEEVK